MDIEMSLQQPSSDIIEIDPIDVESFYYKGVEMSLTLYPQYFTLGNSSKTLTFKIAFETKYQIKLLEQNPQQSLLTIYLDDLNTIQLRKYNWSIDSIQQWQTNMIKVVNRMHFHDFFTPLKKIGEGNFANVYLAQRKKDKALFAVKGFNKKEILANQNGKQALFNEIALMRKASCQNIAKIYGIYETQRSIYMIQEYAQGKNLQRILSKVNGVPKNHRQSIMRGILKALNHLEKLNIVHRDIKPENIIYKGTQESLKIVDFGLATQTNLNKYIFIRCGTPGHVAPQIINLRDSDGIKLFTVSDVFSAGTIFYQLLCNKPLFDGQDNVQILQENRNCDFTKAITKQMKSTISSQEFDLMLKMLKVNPNQRITASQALNHPFLREKTQIEFPLGISNKSIVSADEKQNGTVMLSVNFSSIKPKIKNLIQSRKIDKQN